MSVGCGVCGVCGCVGVWGCGGCGVWAVWAVGGWGVTPLRSTFHRLHLLRLWTPTILFRTWSNGRVVEDCLFARQLYILIVDQMKYELENHSKPGKWTRPDCTQLTCEKNSFFYLFLQFKKLCKGLKTTKM
jgi:hypothetical protein